MNSIVSWLGGKSRLTDKILPLLPKHHCYCEVFAGGAWMLFRKEESKVEIINDINLDLITLYRVVKYHLDELIRYFRWTVVSRDEFERLRTTPADTLTDIQRAARFYYLLKLGFGAKIMNPTFSIAPSSPPRLNLLRIEEDLSAVHLRLARVYIENHPFEKVITRHDRPDTFFYIDPPYFGCETDYGKEIFVREDFYRLRQLLGEVKGKFILSLNDRPEVREIYKGFRIRKVTTTYSASHQGAKTGIFELLIMNYDPLKPNKD